MIKDKKIMGLIALVVVVLFVGGFVIFAISRNQKPAPAVTQTDEVVPTISADSLGIELLATADKHRVKFVIHNTQGITAVEYEASYSALSGGETVEQGLNGEIPPKQIGKATIESEYRELGTCSTGGKCRFDEGVTSVKFTFKITKDGKVYQSEKTLEL